MQFAVLGTDRDVLALVAAAIEAGHQIVWLGEVRSEDAAEVGRLLPELAPRTDWELLLDHATVDAVVVGRGTAPAELRAEQLKRLANDAIPFLAVHPASASVLTYYEVDMARRESHDVVRHYTPLVGAPAIAELAGWVELGTGPIGQVHQIICQRELADCGREAVFRHLARDAELFRRLSGAVRTVSAVGPRSSDASYASLQVQMTGPGTATMRWSVAPSADGPPRATLSLVGDRGVARLRMPADADAPVAGEVDRDWQLEIASGGRNDARPVTTWDAPRDAIDRLAAALTSHADQSNDAASTWSAATAAMEVVDAVDLSLQKGRTIEVHPQQLTEQLAFRGTMAVLGCGLLTLAFLALMVVGLLGGVESLFEQPVFGFWPVVMFALLAFFLLLQVVPWLAGKRHTSAASADSSAAADR